MNGLLAVGSAVVLLTYTELHAPRRHPGFTRAQEGSSRHLPREQSDSSRNRTPTQFGRHLKRISARLGNMTSSVVMPILNSDSWTVRREESDATCGGSAPFSLVEGRVLASQTVVDPDLRSALCGVAQGAEVGHALAGRQAELGEAGQAAEGPQIAHPLAGEELEGGESRPWCNCSVLALPADDAPGILEAEDSGNTGRGATPQAVSRSDKRAGLS